MLAVIHENVIIFFFFFHDYSLNKWFGCFVLFYILKIVDLNYRSEERRVGKECRKGFSFGGSSGY